VPEKAAIPYCRQNRWFVARSSAPWLLTAILCASTAAWAADPLTIERIAVHQYEDGPVLPANHEFLPGESVFFSCRLKGYQVEKDKKDEDVRGVKLGWQMSVADPAGVLVEKDTSGRIEERVLPEDKAWLPKFTRSFLIPPFAPAGVYRISVKVKDDISGSEAAGTLNLRVRGANILPSETLAARNFRFLHSEDDAIPLQPPVYRPGETMWAKFDIVGYRFSEGNHLSVDYGLAIDSGAPADNGKELFAQPSAAGHQSESFYPQRYVPGALSLNLDKNVAPGSYTLVVTIRDQIGSQVVELREGFKVE